jgi:hypothetical protein
MESWITRGELTKMCHERAVSHSMLAEQHRNYWKWWKWSPSHYTWHHDLGRAYERLSYSLHDKDHIIREMALMDGCVLRAIAENIPYQHCVTLRVEKLEGEK